MGKFLSRPVGHAPPLIRASDEVTRSNGTPPPSNQGDDLTISTPDQYNSGSHQAAPIRYVIPNYVPSASRLDNGSPSDANFSAVEHDESTVYEPGGSLYSPTSNNRTLPSTSQTRTFSLDSSFSKIHPETGRAVYRRGSFGGKNAVQIQCDHLLEIIQQAVAASPMVQNEEAIISNASWIMEPYEVLVRNKIKIEEYRNTRKHELTKKHLNLLLEFLESSEPGAWQKFDEVQSGTCQKVLFKHLWLLYTPRTTVFRLDDGIWRAYMIETTETVVARTTVLRIYAWFLDFNGTGTRLIPHREIFEIPSFSSERSIKLLELIPEWFIQQTETFRQQLLDRGKLHWQYNGQPHYQEYTGNAWPHGPHSSSLKVIVDYSTSTRCNIAEDVIVKQSNIACCTPCIGTGIGLKSYPSNGFDDTHTCINHPLPTTSASDVTQEKDDSTLLFCPPKLWAFSLKFKTWKAITHYHLCDVQSQSSFFKAELYMDEKRKNSLDQIVSSHVSGARFVGSNDSLGRKSRGLNILLFGPSGTGKTFTAECISKKFGVALYTVSSGDLGVQPDLLDQRLLETFTRATNWNAIVLLDDVDIYGFDRTASGSAYKRAALLPTFLRHLEYSECLTLVTMASLDMADEALASRIHAVVPFHKFSYGSQKEIWQRCIRSIPKNLIDEGYLIQFVQHDLSKLEKGKHMNMNAWQIRNCIDLALALAGQDQAAGYVLQPEHIETVLRFGEAFRSHVLQDHREGLQATKAHLLNDHPANPFLQHAPQSE